MTLLAAPDPDWPARAAAEAARWRAADMPGLVQIHHIGSTAVPGLPAKPVIDLLAEFDGLSSCEAARGAIEALGYDWMGAHGLPRRRYARADDPVTGRRLFQIHCYAAGDGEAVRHLAFRDALSGNAALRAAYTSVKAACAARHPEGGAQYGACKSGWIDKTEARAMAART
ncbi:MAG: GrpB family protein [Marinibacterium sp.]